MIDVYLFLFDEFLLITKIKRNKKVRPVDVALSFPTENIQLYWSYCAIHVCRGLLVRSRTPWGCHRTRSWISFWRRDTPSLFWISLFLWTDSSSRILTSSMLQVMNDFSSVTVECSAVFQLSVGKKCHILQLMLIKKTNVFCAASGLPHSFIIMHQNRYQQFIGAFILQAASELNKVDSLQPMFYLDIKKKKKSMCST